MCALLIYGSNNGNCVTRESVQTWNATLFLRHIRKMSHTCDQTFKPPESVCLSSYLTLMQSTLYCTNHPIVCKVWLLSSFYGNYQQNATMSNSNPPLINRPIPHLSVKRTRYQCSAHRRNIYCECDEFYYWCCRLFSVRCCSCMHLCVWRVKIRENAHRTMWKHIMYAG